MVYHDLRIICQMSITDIGDKMSLRPGTIVTRFIPSDSRNPCYNHVDWERHSEAGTNGRTDICVGIILDIDETNASVRWVQMCPLVNDRHSPVQENVEHNLLWEVGQLD